MGCNKRRKDNLFKNSITGEIQQQLDEFFCDHRIENSENNCKYFKKKLFSKKEPIIYCKNCKYWYVIID